MSKQIRNSIFIGLLTISFVFPSCWWYSFTGINIDPGIETFSLSQIVDQTQINPQLSQLLYDKMLDKISGETVLSPVNGDGDVQFDGQIIGYDVSPVNSTGDDIAAQSRLKVTVSIQYTNLINEDNSWSQNFSAFQDFDRNLNLTDVESSLLEIINQQLADDIFNKAFVNW